MDQARQISEAVDLRRVMEDSGIDFNRNGFCRCFIHKEKTPSMSIKNNHYKCFGCGAYGGPIDFIMENYGLDFRQALVKLDSTYHLGILGGRQTRRDRMQERENRVLKEAKEQVEEDYNNAYKTLAMLHRVALKVGIDDWAKEMEPALDTYSGMEAKLWLSW